MRPADLAALAATALAGGFLIPQIVKLSRTRDATGVSSTWPALGAVTNSGWFSYLLSRRLWMSVPSTVLVVAFYVTILAHLGRVGRPLRASLLRGAAWAATLGTVAAVGGWSTLGLVLSLSYVVQVSPSLWTAYRTPTPSGVSAGTWWIGLGEASMWAIYGRAYGDLPVTTFAGVALTASTLMLVRYYVTRRRVAAAPAVS